MKGITQKDYQALILASIDNSGYENRELTTDKDKVQFAARTLRSELGWLIEREGLHSACQHWLQGLASVCTILFANGDIIKWAERVKGEPMTEKQKDRLLEEYWPRAAQALYVLINRYEGK